MPSIEVDDVTHRSIEFAAKMAGVSTGEVIARLVAESTAPTAPTATEAPGAGDQRASIFADYGGRQTRARFDPVTHRVEITTGPLAGKSYKTPSGAAIAVVSQHNPTVNPNRNGWGFWTLDDGSGRLLQVLRRR